MGLTPRATGAAAILAAALVAALGTGCGPPSNVTGPGPAEATDAAARAAAGVVTELSAALDQFDTARARAVLRCMERKGFTVHPTPVPKAGPPPPPTGSYPYRDQAPVLAQAQSDGYGLSESTVDSDAKAPPADGPYERLPAAERERYQAAVGTWSQFTLPDGTVMRVRTGGCEEDVLRRSLGDVGKYLTLYAIVSQLSYTVREATDRDPRAVAAVGAYGDCLAAAGYTGVESVDDPLVMATGFHWPRGGPPPSFADAKRKEIALAVADAQCSATTAVDGVLHQVWTDQLGRYLAAHETELVALRDLLRGGLVAIQEILAG